MKLIVAGSREFSNIELMKSHIKRLEPTEIVSGCARGADKLGETIAAELNIPVKRFPADWAKYGRAAGPIRNGCMANYGDALLAFPIGQSRGTRNMIKQMQNLEKNCVVVETEVLPSGERVG